MLARARTRVAAGARAAPGGGNDEAASDSDAESRSFAERTLLQGRKPTLREIKNRSLAFTTHPIEMR